MGAGPKLIDSCSDRVCYAGRSRQSWKSGLIYHRAWPVVEDGGYPITADWSILSVPSESTSVNERRSLDFLLPLFST